MIVTVGTKFYIHLSLHFLQFKMSYSLHPKHMGFRLKFIAALQEEIEKAYIKIRPTAEEIELHCFKSSNLTTYLRQLAKMIIRIRNVNKRITLLKGEKFEQATEYEVMNYLKGLLSHTCDDDIKKFYDQHLLH